MPYLTPQRIEQLELGDAAETPVTPGELVWKLTNVCQVYILQSTAINFATLCVVIGALVCTVLEVYRRVVAPYEDRKVKENGDVFASRLTR